jgi:hypothetical protein
MLFLFRDITEIPNYADKSKSEGVFRANQRNYEAESREDIAELAVISISV